MATTQIRGNTQIIAGTITNAEINASAAIATSKLADNGNFILKDGSITMTGALNMGTHYITGVIDPSNPQDAATKAYVDAQSQGLDIKASVRAIATSPITLSGTQTIDTVALSVNDRILVTAQGSPATNGIYTVQSGAWIRATDADTSAKVTSGLFTFVSEGTNAGNGYVLTTADTITLGSTSLTFTQFSGAGQITAGNGLAKTGNTLNIGATDTSITVGADSLGVNLNGSTLTISSGLKVSSAGITEVEIASGALSATGGLTGGSGTKLSVVLGSATGLQMTGNAIGIKLDAATLALSASGIKVATGGISANELASNAVDLAGVKITGILAGTNGGTGVNNGVKTITLGGNLTTSGAFTTTLTVTADTNVTLPTSGTLVGSADTGTVTGTMIAANTVALGNLATLAANSVIGNSTGSTATPTAVAMTTTSTASAVARRDASANLLANVNVTGVRTQATAAGTTTLVVGDAQVQQFTGSTTQTVVLPDATTLNNGHHYEITNRSSGTVTVNANGGSLIQTLAASSYTRLTLVSNGTSAGTWDSAYGVNNAGTGTVTAVSVATANGFQGSSSGGATPALTLQTTITGIVKGSGNALVAATAGTDFVANANFVVRETPTGAINGANTTFTLANTPTAGTEQVFLNGMLQEPGSGNDYTISGATITYLSAPATGDRLRVAYMK